MDATNIKIELDSDILLTTIEKYKFFIANKRLGQDAFILYNHLQFTARMQGTNSVYAVDKYLMNGLDWGINKVRKTKAFLNKHGLIYYKQEKDEAGKFLKQYIVVKCAGSTNTMPAAQETALPVNGYSGSERQMLNKEVNALTKKENALDKDVFEEIEKRQKRVRFIPPTLQEVKDYIKSNNYNVNADKWMNRYISNGWMVGRTKMVDWQAAVRTWVANDYDNGKIKKTPEEIEEEKDFKRFGADLSKVAHGK